MVSLEDPDKGFRILIPQPGADIRHAHLGQQQKIFSLLEPDGGQKLRKRRAGEVFDHLGAVWDGVVELLAQLLQGDGLIVVQNIADQGLFIPMFAFACQGELHGLLMPSGQLGKEDRQQAADDPVREFIFICLFQIHV